MKTIGEKKTFKKIVKITSIFDNFRIFGVDSTHNELRDQLTSAQRNIVGTNIKNITNIDTSQTLYRKIGFV
jgi:hypothetical protein